MTWSLDRITFTVLIHPNQNAVPKLSILIFITVFNILNERLGAGLNSYELWAVHVSQTSSRITANIIYEVG